MITPIISLELENTAAMQTFFIDAVAPLLTGTFLLMHLGIYLLYAYFQYTLSKKLNIQYSWMAWIPIFNFFNLLFIAGKTIGWWLKWVLITVLLGVLFGLSSYFLPGLIGPPASIFFTIVFFVAMLGSTLYMHIDILHGISRRTGHGVWWTLGLILAGWLIFPVGALHYQRGDEIHPRPFTGWKKWLLIILSIGIEVLILIGIIGLVLFRANM